MQVSLNYLSELTGIDRRRVTRLLSDLPHEPGPNRAKHYDSATALRVLFGGLADGDRLDPSAERARLDRARAELSELELSRRRGELIPVPEVAAAWSQNVAIAKGRLLSLPSRVSGDVLRLKSQREVENLIRDQITNILEELSGEIESRAG